jgi:hypothetical protein
MTSGLAATRTLPGPAFDPLAQAPARQIIRIALIAPALGQFKRSDIV